jgi:hemolysin III
MTVSRHVRPQREEMASAAILGAATVASAAGLAYLTTRAIPALDALALVSLAVYGASLVAAFAVSALYHGARHGRWRSVFQKIDHCTIFLLIAGTYKPVAMLPLRHHAGVTLLLSIWALALAGVALRLFGPRLYDRIAVLLYLGLGWLCLAWSVSLYETVATTPMLLMLAGALSYTGGLLFYRWHRLPFSNSIWHLCVVAGSAWFFIAIIYLRPA